MVTSMGGKHLITLQEWTNEEIDTCLDTAYDLKLKFARKIPHASLRDETVFMMFFDESTRTRNSTEAGATQLGAHAHFLDASKMQIQHGDSAKDTAMILSSYGHAIACRHCGWGVGNAYIREAFEGADVVIPKNWGSWYADSKKAPTDEKRAGNTILTQEELERLAKNKSWKCTQELMDLTSENSIYMHALPADRVNEVEDSVIDGPHSIIYQEAENRLHTVKAVMDLTMGGRR